MPNIKFNYLYRDSANYKNFGFVIFNNPDRCTFEEVSIIITSKLIDSTWFYADQLGLPELYLATFDLNVDPTWHEFESIEYTDDMSNATISLIEFITSIT